MTQVAIPLPYVAIWQRSIGTVGPLVCAVLNPLILLAQPLDADFCQRRFLPHHLNERPRMDACDPHQNEYLAAAGALHEQTPPPAPQRQDLAVGDFVSGTTDGRRWSGRIEWFSGRTMCVNVDGAWVNVPIADITH